MIEKLRELVETALDWFPDVRVNNIEPGRWMWTIMLRTPTAFVAVYIGNDFLARYGDLALVTEVRYQLMKERG